MKRINRTIHLLDHPTDKSCVHLICTNYSILISS